MAKFAFKIAYTTDPNKIEPALQSGEIDEGDLVVVNQNGKGSFRFITKEKEILTFPAMEEIETKVETVVQEKIETSVQEKIDETFSWSDT